VNDRDEQLKEESKFAQMGLQVVNNEAYKAAFNVRRAQIFDVFCKTNKDQADIREEAWRTMKNLDSLDAFFKTALTTGKMADITLDELEKSNQTGIK
jgi:hypothetical protein